MDIGVENAGFENLACIEFDPNAAATLRHNALNRNPKLRVIEADIRTLDPLSVAKPGIDLLHGGPPCQAFSLIGKRASLGDERGMLLFEMIRFAKTLKPRAILLEQVKGLLSAPDEKGVRGGVFKKFLSELESLGYCPKWTTLCAADYGVPQLRERVFIVATRGHNGYSFPAPTHDEKTVWILQDALVKYISNTTDLNLRKLVSEALKEVNILSLRYAGPASSGMRLLEIENLYAGQIPAIQGDTDFNKLLQAAIIPPRIDLEKKLLNKKPRAIITL
jgi:DNA-cytosine methyltransferase